MTATTNVFNTAASFDSTVIPKLTKVVFYQDASTGQCMGFAFTYDVNGAETAENQFGTASNIIGTYNIDTNNRIQNLSIS